MNKNAKMTDSPKKQNGLQQIATQIIDDDRGETKKQLRINSQYFETDDENQNKQDKRQRQYSGNVFYENSEMQSELKIYRILKIISLILLVFLVFSLFLVNCVKEYDGFCPKNANCKVYIHCEQGFQYDSSVKQCILKDQLLFNVQKICLNAIQELTYRYGDSECEKQYKQLPNKHIDDILVGLDKSHKNRLRLQLQHFLYNQLHQEKYNFTFRANRIIPKITGHSTVCSLILYLKSKQFEFKFVFILFIICIILAVYTKFESSFRVHKIYVQLEHKTISQLSVNINYARQELQNKYGGISEEEWKEVEKLRVQKRKILSENNMFVYWKTI